MQRNTRLKHLQASPVGQWQQLAERTLWPQPGHQDEEEVNQSEGGVDADGEGSGQDGGQQEHVPRQGVGVSPRVAFLRESCGQKKFGAKPGKKDTTQATPPPPTHTTSLSFFHFFYKKMALLQTRHGKEHPYAVDVQVGGGRALGEREGDPIKRPFTSLNSTNACHSNQTFLSASYSCF